MNKKLEQAIALIESAMADIKQSDNADKNNANQMFRRQLKGAVENIETGMKWKVLFETDYVIYHEATDYVIQFSGGGIVVYGDKDEAELDRCGDEVIIPCTDLPIHWKAKLISQINEL
jgi:hypothetical protein